MTLEEAQKIKKICDKINDIEQTIKEIHDCCYIDLNIIKSLHFDNATTVRALKGSKVYNHIIQGYKEERDELIRKLNNM